MPVNTLTYNININDYYDTIYNNLPIFLDNYQHVFDPKSNNTTKKYLNLGYELNQAYTMSIITTILLYSHM